MAHPKPARPSHVNTQSTARQMGGTLPSERPDVAFQRAVEATRLRMKCSYREAVQITAASNPNLAKSYRSFTQALRILNLPPLNRGEG